MKNGPQNSSYYSVVQLKNKKKNHGHQVFDITLQSFLSIVTNTANIKVAVAAIYFDFASFKK